MLTDILYMVLMVASFVGVFALLGLMLSENR